MKRDMRNGPIKHELEVGSRVTQKRLTRFNTKEREWCVIRQNGETKKKVLRILLHINVQTNYLLRDKEGDLTLETLPSLVRKQVTSDRVTDRVSSLSNM